MSQVNSNVVSNSKPKRRNLLQDTVVVIHTGALGDLLVSTAALEEVIQLFPNNNICVLGNSLWQEILLPDRWPQIGKLLLLSDKSHAEVWLPLNNSKWRPTGEKISINSCFRGAVATFNFRMESYRFAWGPFLARVPIRVGSCPKAMRWLYTHWAPWQGLNPQIHERERFLNFVRAFAPVNDWANLSLPPLQKGLAWNSNSTRILINPTSSRREKAWSAARFHELALRIKKEHPNLQIFILGAPNETAWLEEVSQGVFTIIQPANLSVLIKEVADARLLLTNTSSVQFIACSMNTPVLTLMGRARPEVWRPLGINSHFVKSPFVEESGNDIFAEEVAAFKLITVEEVQKRVSEILSTAAN